MIKQNNVWTIGRTWFSERIMIMWQLFAYIYFYVSIADFIMAQTKLFGKNLQEYDDIDVDALLETLSPEELEQLGQDLIDPDVSQLQLFHNMDES